MIQEWAEEGERGRERTGKESGRVKGVKERRNMRMTTLVSVGISSQAQVLELPLAIFSPRPLFLSLFLSLLSRFS